LGGTLVPDLSLPVPVGPRCISSFLESDELIKSVFKRCRFLLPVSRYEGLKISGGSPRSGAKFSNPTRQKLSVQRQLKECWEYSNISLGVKFRGIGS